MEKWEYATAILYANRDHEGAAEYVRKKFPWADKMAKYSPTALTPLLDNWGREGWELVHIEPVRVGGNRDICYGGTIMEYSHAYFGAFKRRIPESD